MQSVTKYMCVRARNSREESRHTKLSPQSVVKEQEKNPIKADNETRVDEQNDNWVILCIGLPLSSLIADNWRDWLLKEVINRG